MDKIYIRDLALRCIIGVFDEERTKPQDVVLNIVLECDLAPGARTDALEQSVDYKVIKQRIVALVEDSQFALIETLVDRVATACLESDGVERVSVTLDKPGALRFARSVAVEITRERRGG